MSSQSPDGASRYVYLASDVDDWLTQVAARRRALEELLMLATVRAGVTRRLRGHLRLAEQQLQTSGSDDSSRHAAYALLDEARETLVALLAAANAAWSPAVPGPAPGPRETVPEHGHRPSLGYTTAEMENYLNRCTEADAKLVARVERKVQALREQLARLADPRPPGRGPVATPAHDQSATIDCVQAAEDSVTATYDYLERHFAATVRSPETARLEP